MRASRTDREQAIEMLKTAFVQDRLTKDELDARVGQALAARTYADLDAATLGIPLSPELPELPEFPHLPYLPYLRQTTPEPLSPHVPRRSEVRRAVRSGAGALGVVMVAIGTVAGVAVNPVAGVAVAVFFVILVAITAGFAALAIRGALVIEERSRRRKRSSGRTPPWPGPGSDPARWRPFSAPPQQRGTDAALASALRTARSSPLTRRGAATGGLRTKFPRGRR